MVINEECKKCQIKRNVDKYPDNVTKEEIKKYQYEVNEIIRNSDGLTTPQIAEKMDNLRRDMFGNLMDYTEIKKHYNQLMLECLPNMKNRVNIAEDHLKMAIQYAIESVNPLTMQTYHSMGYTVFEMFRERHTLSGLFHSFVGAFGSMSIYGSIWLYRAYKVFFAAGIVGALLYLIRYKMRRKISGREWFFHINMLYCIFMPVFLTIYYAYTTDYQNQGRYLLPALLPLMYYMIKGIQKLSEISFRGRTFPRWLVNAGIAVCFLIIIGGTIEMVYVRALPVYLETGLVLE